MKKRIVQRAWKRLYEFADRFVESEIRNYESLRRYAETGTHFPTTSTLEFQMFQNPLAKFDEDYLAELLYIQKTILPFLKRSAGIKE